jgi:predicted nucleic acid-binding protein
MSRPYIDTSVIIRLLTGDDPEKQKHSQALFEQVERGEMMVAAPDTVVADAVFVLASRRLYNVPRQHIAALLTPLVRLPGFQVQNRRIVLAALQLYGTTDRLDFGDAMLAAAMGRNSSDMIYSYDQDFDRLPGITRREPSSDAT